MTSIDRDAVLREIGLRLATPPTPAEAKAHAMVDRLVPVMEGWFRNHAEHPAARPYRYNAIGDS